MGAEYRNGKNYAIGKGRIPCLSCGSGIINNYVRCEVCGCINHQFCLRKHDRVCMACLRKFDDPKDYYEYMDREPSCDIWEPHQRFKARFGTSVSVEKYGPWMLFWIDRREPKPFFIRTRISPINVIEERFMGGLDDI